MNPVEHKPSGPPKPPRASQMDSPSDPARTVSSPPKKPPRVSQPDATEYVEMNIARAYASGVAAPSQDPMYSRVEVYASIDHSASASPPTSKLS